ncbi:MAG TPA: Rieske (2Fe-2S) protein [Verrucomicrobiae bacterium]|nr:Rieske (2Fe-2S) protein [Verrucomicrobiae bacterium]
MNRRQFLILTAAAVVSGCQSMGGGSSTAAHGRRVINAGPIRNYAADGLYDRFRDQGFFVVRKGDELFALSSYCTHRRCKLSGECDRSFYCPCHGSTFNPNGKVTGGPATRDLPALPSFTNEDAQLLVTVPAS